MNNITVTLSFSTIQEAVEFLQPTENKAVPQTVKIEETPKPKTKKKPAPKPEPVEEVESDLDLDGLADIGADLEDAPQSDEVVQEETETEAEPTEDKLGGFKSYADLFKEAQAWFPGEKKADLVKILKDVKDKVFDGETAPEKLINMTPEQEERFIPAFLEATKDLRK